MSNWILVVGSWIGVFGLVMSCQTAKNAEEVPAGLLLAKPIISFSGDTLPAKTFSDSTFAKLNQARLDAEALATQYPDSVELAIWHGRRVAYMGRYHEAIEVFGEALKKWPNDHRLYRHRGHRYITTRQLDKAIADFERAAELAKDQPNAIEPDGIPNRLNQPLSNDKFNIYYHLGLVYFLKGDFDKALAAYTECMQHSDNPDLQIATSYWLYMTYHRLGQQELALSFLNSIDTQVKLVENDAYLELLQLFKGERTGILDENHPTVKYGIGAHLLMKGDQESAEMIWKEILMHDAWDAFGYIAAEAELARATSAP